MYGCNCHIRCLSGSVTRVGSELRGRISRIGSDGNETLGLSGSVTRVGSELRGRISRIGSDGNETLGLSGSVNRVGGGLRGYASLVCTVNGSKSYWMWDAGEILYWDNLEYISLD